MNRSKSRGTAAETAVVRYLRDQGWAAVERRTLHGRLDKGDIAGLPVVVEVKNCARTELAKWVAEARAEAGNAGQRVGVVWHKRRGHAEPGRWYVTMTGADFVELLRTYDEGAVR